VAKGGMEEALALRVWARPLELEHDRLMFLAITGIADEKRRDFLERIFPHDIMNTATGLAWILVALLESRKN
jgi:hypothetical protein